MWMKLMILFVVRAFVACASFVAWNALAEAPDTVSREIRLQHGVVWVEDKLLVTEWFTGNNTALWELFKAARDKGTNILEIARSLLKSEDLELQQCSASIKDGRLHATILSRVVEKELARPAKLRWVVANGGEAIYFDGLPIGKDGAEMWVYGHTNNYVLYFPNLGIQTASLEHWPDYLKHFDLPSPDRIPELICKVKVSGTFQPLYHRQKSPTHPDLGLLQQLQTDKRLSENDLYSLATGMWVAKAGSYPISE
jgi:hypothetical protein